MADTIVSVFNQAIGACRVRASVASETENSPESRACVLWYETILKQVLRAAPWPAASSYQRLAQFIDASDTDTWEAGNPAPGYAYAFNLPSDMVHPRTLTTWESFEISVVGSKKRLSCNNKTPILNYTKYLTSITEWDDAFRMAVVYGLASVICGKITGSTTLSRDLQDQANGLILAARTAAANVDDEIYETIPDWFKARGFGITTQTRYYYPNGNLLANIGGVNG